jgi:hypothetical protein
MDAIEKRQLLGSLSILMLFGCGGGQSLGGDSDADTRVDGDAADAPGDGSTGDFSWDPSIENMGEPGWRDSSEPWCQTFEGPITAYDIWSFEGGVHVVVSDNQNTGMTYEDVNHIYFNDGSGWRKTYEETASSVGPDITTCFFNIMGLSDGSLFAWSGPSHGCNLAHIKDGNLEWENFTVYDLFVVNDTLAYAIYSYGDLKIIQYDGTSWSPIPAVIPYGVYNIWADETSVFCGGAGGSIVSLEGSEWIVHDTQTLATVESMWGFSGEDVWAGFDDGSLRHFDGVSWEQIDWPQANPSGYNSINGMWGQDGKLFFHTPYQLTMWDGASFTVLASWESAGIYINAIWGNSPSEVFLAVEDANYEGTGCGPKYVLWWDGSRFHWF